MSRSLGWGIYPWVRMADIAGRWSVYADRQNKYQQQRRRASDQQYGRRTDDLTMPSGTGTLHIHWMAVALLCVLVAGLVWVLITQLGPLLH